MKPSLLDRLTPDHATLAKIPSIAAAFAQLERALDEGGGKVGAAFLDAPGGAEPDKLQIAIGALRGIGVLQLVASYPVAGGAIAVAEPESVRLLTLYARGLLPAEAGEAIQMHYVLRDSAAWPIAAPTHVSKHTRDQSDFQAADLDRLLVNLRDHTLSRMNRIEYQRHGTYWFHGNFDRLSAAFGVRTDDPFVVIALLAAMNANRLRPDYVADVEHQKAAARDHQASVEATGDATALANARMESEAWRPPVAGEIAGLEPLLTLETAPLGTLAPAIGGGHWARVERGWQWAGLSDCPGSTFPRPGGDWNGKLIAPVPRTRAAAEPEAAPSAVATTTKRRPRA